MYIIKRRQLSFLLLVLFAFASCKEEKKTPEVFAAVNEKFGDDPPLAKDIAITQLKKPDKDGNTILFTAQFDKDVIKGPYHGIIAGNEEVILRDDGQNGDEVKGDGVFSILLKENLDSLYRKLALFQKDRQEQFSKGELVSFVNRRGSTVKELRSFDIESLKKGERIRLTGFFPTTKSDKLATSKSLMITDLSVIEDPSRTFNPCTGAGTANGAWTFEKLMRNLVGTSSVSLEEFTRSWLDTWMADRTINDDNVPQRRTSLFNQVIKPWLVKSGSASASITEANWKTKPIDLKFAPFRLMAIVNRLDLRGASGYGSSKGGEGRFVFCAINPNCNGVLQFTVIFEYGINKKGCDLKTFAQQWFDLRDDPFDANFNNALQQITDQFAGSNTSPSKPNGSSLNQLRTNEIAIGAPWELREFKLNASSHLLAMSTVTREPQEKYNRLAIPPASTANRLLLATWVNDHDDEILDDTYEVPPTLTTGEKFLGAKAHTEDLAHCWDAQVSGSGMITDDEVRHFFSLNTCSGCHGGEGKTPAFTHIAPAFFGTSPGLSGFLTGKGTDDSSDDDATEDLLFFIKDPANRPAPSTATRRGFNDLKRRLDDLATFVSASCSDKLFDLLVNLQRKPLNMTH